MSPNRRLSRNRIQVIGGGFLLVAALGVAVVTSSSVACGCTDVRPETTRAPGSAAADAPVTSASASPGSAPTGSTPTGSPRGSLSPTAVEEVTPEPPIGLQETADFGPGATVRVSKVESVNGTARGPGEIAGPALRLTLELTNTSAQVLSLESLVVSLEVGPERSPAPNLTDPTSKPLHGGLAPGRSATGVYVYTVARSDRDLVEVTVSSTAAQPVVVFQGAVQP